MHCHHEKLVIVDDEIAFVGGIDLTTLAGDRYDTNEHAAQGARSAGTTRARCCAGRSCATSPRTSPCAGRRRRTRRWRCRRRCRRPATRRSSSSAPCPRAPTACSRAASSPCWRPTSARCGRRKRLIYLENQFLWSPEIVHILETKLRDPPSHDFRVRRPAPAQGQQRPGRHARDARPARRGRRRRASSFLAATIMSRSGERVRPALRARQDRHRRRRVARDRLAPTSTSTRCSTTPRSTSSPATRSSPAARA